MTIWLVFTTVVLLGFAVLETIAIVSPGGTTYTKAIKRWLGIEPKKPYRQWGILGFASAFTIFYVWFLIHVISSWPWETS